MKASEKFDEASQKLALVKVKNIALDQMIDNVKSYIDKIYCNLDTWLTTQIEPIINALKNK